MSTSPGISILGWFGLASYRHSMHHSQANLGIPRIIWVGDMPTLEHQNTFFPQHKYSDTPLGNATIFYFLNTAPTQAFYQCSTVLLNLSRFFLRKIFSRLVSVKLDNLRAQQEQDTETKIIVLWSTVPVLFCLRTSGLQYEQVTEHRCFRYAKTIMRIRRVHFKLDLDPKSDPNPT